MQKKYNKDNVFAKILRGEIPCTKVYEDEKILAFKDINPQAPVHVLVIPKAEFICFDDFITGSTENDVSYFFKKVREIAKSLGVSETGYRVVANNGEKAGQIVPHFHVHVMGYK